MTSSSARVGTLLFTLALIGACKPDKPQGTGLVVADAGGPAVAVPEAGPFDVSQCVGCQLAPIPAWTFEGIYRDAHCTDPLAQLTAPACTQVPAVGSVSITYVDEVGPHKANTPATVTLVDQIDATAPRYRKAGTACVRANEGATDITPVGCAGQRVCRDATGALTCTAACRTFGSGCPDFEETRMYASINDPTVKPGAGGGGGNLARLQQCCAALAAQARALGPSPEAGLIAAAAAQCSALVQAAGPNGNAPELGAVRAALAGRPVPAICAGF